MESSLKELAGYRLARAREMLSASILISKWKNM